MKKITTMKELLNERLSEEDIIKFVSNYDNKFSELEKENKGKDKEIGRLNNIINTMDKEIDNLCKNQKKEIERLNKIIQIKQNRINKLNKKLIRRDNIIEDLKSILKSKGYETYIPILERSDKEC